ncbi:hypothetical protein Ddye_002389 [Dipteronia dyeriana]|uniref:Uncharacterized protein n=1 Tax=Dipteronia dyeriana TaxID=168575 RepID=A0AAD9XR13_9ROSI|nr:hypothetical protein Ddye_002389 [Dipteronia dyeriana]
MKSFLQGWALAITPRGHITCGIGGWVVSELFDIVHSLRPPPFRYINCIVKESVRGFRAGCSLNLFWMVQIGFCFVDILTVGKHHALSCPDIQNWCPEWCLCIKNIYGWSQNRLFFSNSSYNGGWIDLLCAEALLYVLGR